ncbi:L-lactate dehydrogenase [Virgibacillus sp. C22-A2]|uniref:L-lactate dehydrogenase n=1 Tax=Virgibacillus tibetensis TaxID=3042313 RepID=A0ABU6KDL0_9BACI|nr:L-lactate dehydrogenase [Virgibacillus sp. C22-A2]
MACGINRVVVIGTGFVGSSYAYSLVNQAITEELVLIDLNEEKAKGEEMDLNHGVGFSTTATKVWAGDYSDCKDADIVCITAGLNQNQGKTRLDSVGENTEIFKSIIQPVMDSGFDGIFIIATNPVDIMTYITWKLSGLPKEKVIGTGTLLDTSRYRFMLGEYFNVNSQDVNGYIIGEHGDTQVAAMSSTTIGGKRIVDIVNSSSKYSMKELDDISVYVRDVAYKIVQCKGSTYYGIGMGLSRLTKAILKNENIILPVSTYLNGEYGFKDIYAGFPASINRNGSGEIVELDLNEDEKKKLFYSIELLKNTLAKKF